LINSLAHAAGRLYGRVRRARHHLQEKGFNRKDCGHENSVY
jgi:hypothetical protein